MNKTKTKSSEKQLESHVISLKDFGVEIPETSVSSRMYSTCIRALLQNWRQGTVGCKGRSDVNFSNRKPFKQKGTGRARAGSARSPLWKGGGVIFGPQARVKTLRVLKKQKRQVLHNLFAQYATSKNIFMLDFAIKEDRPKTAAAFDAIKKIGLSQKKLVLFLTTDDLYNYASFANIPSVRILYYDQPNVFDLSHVDAWMVLKKDMNSFKAMVEKWS